MAAQRSSLLCVPPVVSSSAAKHTKHCARTVSSSSSPNTAECWSLTACMLQAKPILECLWQITKLGLLSVRLSLFFWCLCRKC